MTPKPERSNTINIAFGAGARSIADQLAEQGYSLRARLVQPYQQISDSIALLEVEGYLSDKLVTSLRQQLVRHICAIFRGAIEERK